VRWYTLLQRMSTLVGGIVIAGWLASSRHARRSAQVVVSSPSRLWTLAALLAIAGIGALANGLRGTFFDSDGNTVVRFLAYAAVGGMSGLALALFGYGIRQSLRSPIPRRRTEASTFS
jgi:hypothetical protein